MKNILHYSAINIVIYSMTHNEALHNIVTYSTIDFTEHYMMTVLVECVMWLWVVWHRVLSNLQQCTVVKGAQLNRNFCTKIRFSYGDKCDIWSLLSDSGVFDTIRSELKVGQHQEKNFRPLLESDRAVEDRMVSKTPKLDRRDHISNLIVENLFLVIFDKILLIIFRCFNFLHINVVKYVTFLWSSSANTQWDTVIRFSEILDVHFINTFSNVNLISQNISISMQG